MANVRQELKDARASLPCVDGAHTAAADGAETMAKVIAALEQEVRTLDDALCQPRESETGVASLLRSSDPFAWPELHAVMVRLQADMEAEVARSPAELPVGQRRDAAAANTPYVVQEMQSSSD